MTLLPSFKWTIQISNKFYVLLGKEFCLGVYKNQFEFNQTMFFWEILKKEEIGECISVNWIFLMCKM